jgi:hypothetical protein
VQIGERAKKVVEPATKGANANHPTGGVPVEEDRIIERELDAFVEVGGVLVGAEVVHLRSAFTVEGEHIALGAVKVAGNAVWHEALAVGGEGEG